jgi:LemA protein
MILIIEVLALFFMIVGIFATGIGIYNNLVMIKNDIDKAWANIDVLLKQRHDELPKLIDTCKGYMKYEQGALESVTKARTSFMNASTIEEKTLAENRLVQGLKSLFAVAENYPDLKANQGFIQLEGRISTLENAIADRREFFNESVNVYNIRIAQFPDLLVARMMGYVPKTLLEVPSSDKEDVKVQF